MMSVRRLRRVHPSRASCRSPGNARRRSCRCIRGSPRTLQTRASSTAATGSGLEEEPPPILRLRWGLFNFQDLYWVLTQIEQHFSLFLEDGTPVRATLNCSFQEKERSGPLGSGGSSSSSKSASGEGDTVKSHTVKGGETLSAIHARHTGDPTSWRQTARANQVWNPRRLETGTPLTISHSIGPQRFHK